MRKIKVHQMTSPRTGRPVANQFIIKSEGRFKNDVGQIKTSIIKTFQSYDSIIARITYKGWDTPIVELDKNYWDYSRTTSKYRNEFLNEGTQETRQKIKEGKYKLVNLN